MYSICCLHYAVSGNHRAQNVPGGRWYIASSMPNYSDFAKYVSTVIPCTSLHTLRFLLSVYIICRGTFSVFLCLSLRVLDKKKYCRCSTLFAPKEHYGVLFRSVTKFTLDDFDNGLIDIGPDKEIL